MTVVGERDVVNAEAVALDVRPARLGSRALALGVDICVQAVLVLFLLAVTSITLRALPPSLVDDALFDTTLRTVVVIVLLAYPTLIETVTNGRSVGKLLVGLRVVRDDGGPIRLRHAFTRALIGFAVEWPGLLLPLVTWMISLGTMLGSARGRRLGDLAAGTMVVHVRRPYPWLPVPPMPQHLAGWAAVADLAAVDDRLALSVRQYLSRAALLRDPHRSRLRQDLAGEVAARVRPAPPAGTPPDAFLAAVLAERRRRSLPAGDALAERLMRDPGGTGIALRSAAPD
ncbi:RDD family protein [Actinoplanes sp. DH11]|uniref:RDD family protein n=1 Tax=Actinoplanes sp. DH11 TaxID=2857011 RepID=UPI001E530DC2|nr:RDD family protein [Actinoplanes sp. DH11]